MVSVCLVSIFQLAVSCPGMEAIFLQHSFMLQVQPKTEESPEPGARMALMASGRKNGCGSNWKTFGSLYVLAELPYLLELKGEVEAWKVHVPLAQTRGWYTRFWGGGTPHSCTVAWPEHM